MQFQPMYYDGELLLPMIELNMTLNQSVAIITDLKRKQLLMNQLVDHSQYYIFRAGQSEYMRLTVEELITFLIQVTERNERAELLMDYFVLKEERKVRIKDLSSSKRMYVTLLRVFLRISLHLYWRNLIFTWKRRIVVNSNGFWMIFRKKSRY
ncbi:hypothetical protein MKX41_19165 [Paenibacillus sp. FSL R5-0475]|uniref:hypothetical protein n=1 Tax=Paenibacillus sp. FSL R5-0475 TaxID=2921643 RepID=UPI0030F70A07